MQPPAAFTGRSRIPFEIGTYDVTVGQYVAFLNAVATQSDPYSLYNSRMALRVVSDGRDFPNPRFRQLQLRGHGHGPGRGEHARVCCQLGRCGAVLQLAG